MIISRIQGGLGNQMFQYAAARALALRLGVETKLDLSWFASIAKNETPRRFMLSAFPNLSATEATEKEIEELKFTPQSLFSRFLRRPRRRAFSYNVEPYFDYWAGIEQLNASSYLAGYWQNELYFKHASEIIRQDFTFPSFPTEATAEAAKLICSVQPSVAVHIRRGDYASNHVTESYHGLCSAEYYNRALDELAMRLGAELNLFLFSDDPNWVRRKFDTRGFSSTILDFPEHTDVPWNDMHLMSLCSHHVIANSSFSWWGAWLATGNGFVYAPQRWFAAPAMEHNNPAAASWIQL